MLNAQEQGSATVRGYVYDESESPLGSATVTLHLPADSSIIKIDVSGVDGLFQLAQLPTSTYFLRITSIGFVPFESQPFAIIQNSTHKIGPVVLQRNTEQLAEAEVFATKPLVDIQHDRTLVNVDQLLSSQGGSALDVLKQSPGLSLNNEGAISIRGKQNILVLIDGQQTFMTGTELTDYLRGLPAGLLDQIEIITQPSAKYDAMGTGGIVNLKTKRGQQQGFNASISIGAQQGRYANSANSLNVNWKIDNFNVTTNYGYVFNSPLMELTQQNIFEDITGTVEATVDQKYESASTNHTHDIRTGIDYATDRTTLGVVYTGTFKTYPTQSATSYSDIFDGRYRPIATNGATTNRKARNPKQGVNLYLHQKIDENGQELSITADYLAYNRDVLYYLVNTYTDLHEPANGQISQIRQNIPSDIDIYGIKSSYTLSIAEAIKLEAGVKSTFMKMDNNALFQLHDVSTRRFETDASRSVHYLFGESVSAAYLTYHQKFNDSWALQAGLRVAHTRNNGEEINTSAHFNRRYTQFFPSLMLTSNVNDRHTLAISYGRRINRPIYEQLIPFAFYADLLYYQVGNPHLRPELAHNVDISHTFADKLMTTLSYSHVDDIQSGIFRTQPGSLVLEEAFTNIAVRSSYGLSVDYAEELAPWYSLSVNATVMNNHFSGALAGEYIDIGKTSWMGQLVSQFRLGKSWNAELSANYQSATQEDAISVLLGMGSVNLTVGKQILNNKGSLRFLLLDPLNTGRYSYYSKLGILTSHFKTYWDNQKFGLSLSYRFGSSKVAPAREQTSSMEEEVERL